MFHPMRYSVGEAISEILMISAFLNFVSQRYFEELNTITGWWLSLPSEKYDFVSCDYYSQYMDKLSNKHNYNIQFENYNYVLENSMCIYTPFFQFRNFNDENKMFPRLLRYPVP